MQKFLDHFAEYYINRYAQNTREHLLILPSKRSVVALKFAFAQQPETLWLPEITDIVSFIEKLSGLEIINNQDALMLLFRSNNEIQPEAEAFETFYSWGSVLLSDFNEIDRFLVDTSSFFEHHKAIKELDYFGEQNTEMIKSYIAFWERLPKLYQHFKNKLLKQNKAFQGLAYRQATTKIEQYLSKHENQQLFFIGFNALNKAEEHIIESALKENSAQIAWDIDSSFLKEKQHPANTFINTYQNQWRPYNKNFISLDHSKYDESKDINIIPTPKSIGQAKAMAYVLNTLTDSQVKNTAIIINDENLISPILNSIPKSIENVNITMGLTLQHSPLANVFELLFEVQKQKSDRIQYSFLKSLFSAEIFRDRRFKEHKSILSHLEKHKLTSISFSELMSIKTFGLALKAVLMCVKPYKTAQDFIYALVHLINSLLESIQQPYKVYLLSYQYLVYELESLLKKEKNLSHMAVYLLFRDMQREQKLSFKGSKSSGLQVMGMLESRLLDFETIIMTSVNEGILPTGKTNNSYMTFSLKKTYGLPTHTEKDSIYAYHFFRLLQRCKRCFLIYDNDQTGFNKGDKSRFINYMEVFKHSQHKIKTRPFALSTTLESQNPLQVKKTKEVMAILHQQAERGFSPTALSTYISNPIKFYKKYVLKVKETESIEDVIDARDYGTVLHHTIEKLYKNISELQPSSIAYFENHYLNLLKSEFDKIYAESEYAHGQNRIQFEIAKTSLLRFFTKEKQKLKSGKVDIIEIEEDSEIYVETKHHKVKLKGQIDRIDRYKDNLRIIDLKSGSVSSSHLKFDDFEETISDEEKAKAFQTLFYAYIYSKTHKVEQMQAGIISFKNLDSWFMPVKHIKNTTIDESFLSAFEAKLFQLIDEILDPNIPFLEKESIFDS